MQASYWSKFTSKTLSRRRALAGTVATATAALLIAACGGDEDESGSSGAANSGNTSGGGSGTNSGSGGSSGASGASGSSGSNGLISKPVDTTSQAQKGGTLKLVQFSDAPSLDPGVANRANEHVRAYAYSQLFRHEPGYLKATESKPVPDIGESWEFSPDGLTMTVKLRKAVKWHNRAPVSGRAVDIDDVLFSYNRFAELGGARGFVVNSVNPAAPVLSFEATDAETIVVKLKEPTSYITAIFAYDAAIMPILPKETGSTFDPRANQIGTGPFELVEYIPSVSFEYKRNLDYYDQSIPSADRVELPILTEYAARLAQFKAGNIHAMINQNRVFNEDIVATKNDVPALQVYEEGLPGEAPVHTAFGWLPDGNSPWIDERVRQAYSMSIDRDAWIDAAYNVARFESQGLPVQAEWHTCISSALSPFWLDPRDSSFGPNAQYFQFAIAEAKKLLAAAGFPDGFEYDSQFPEGNPYGPSFATQLAVMEGMASEAGFRANPKPIPFPAEYNPRFRDGKGQHEGVAYKIGAGFSQDATSRIVYELYSKGGSNFYGFSAAGKNDQAGDPVLDSLIEKAKAELDSEKRAAITHDIQGELAKKQWMVTWPGEATSFLMAWPSVQNFQVHQEGREGSRAPASYWWLDESQAPFKS